MGQNPESCPQGIELNRSTKPSEQSMKRNLGEQLSLCSPSKGGKHKSEPAATTETEILRYCKIDVLSQESTNNSETHQRDLETAPAGVYYNHGKRRKKNKKNEKNKTEKTN
jgi:hypothetical protein